MPDLIPSEREILSNSLLQQWQLEVLFSKARVRVLAASRQIGKSLTLRALVVKEMLENPGLEVVYLAPTIAQCKRIGFRPLLLSHDTVLQPEHVHEINKTDMTAEMFNGSRITFAGTEAVEKLRGLTCDLLVLDEYAIMSEEVLTTLEPIISARQGRIVIAGTPIGLNHFYDVVEMGRKGGPKKVPGYRSWILPITDEQVVVPNKAIRIKNAQATLSPQAFAQEYLVSFTAAAGLVYKSYSIEESASNLELSDKLGLFIGLDFNVAKMVAVVGQRVSTVIDGQKVETMHILDEIVLRDTNTQMMAAEINRRYKAIWGGRITIIPDASGSSRKTSASSTDHAILRSAGFRVDSPTTNPAINDRVNAVNAMFMTASGRRRLFVHSRCKELITSLSAQTYDKKTNAPEKGSGHSDISAAPDALGYLINKLYPIKTSMVGIVNTSGFTH